MGPGKSCNAHPMVFLTCSKMADLLSRFSLFSGNPERTITSIFDFQNPDMWLTFRGDAYTATESFIAEQAARHEDGEDRCLFTNRYKYLLRHFFNFCQDNKWHDGFVNPHRARRFFLHYFDDGRETPMTSLSANTLLTTKRCLEALYKHQVRYVNADLEQRRFNGDHPDTITLLEKKVKELLNHPDGDKEV